MRSTADFILACDKVRIEGNPAKVATVRDPMFWEDLKEHLMRAAVTAPEELKQEIIETFEAMLINEIAPRCEQNGYEAMNLINIKWHIERTAKALKEAT